MCVPFLFKISINKPSYCLFDFRLNWQQAYINTVVSIPLKVISLMFHEDTFIWFWNVSVGTSALHWLDFVEQSDWKWDTECLCLMVIIPSPWLGVPISNFTPKSIFMPVFPIMNSKSAAHFLKLIHPFTLLPERPLQLVAN